MSRLDQHIDAVRTRFLFQRFADFGAWSLLIAAGAALVYVLVSRLFSITPLPDMLVLGGMGILACLVALVLAVVRSPSREAAAVKVDETLGLKERFSTAILARESTDPFARAAVRDAERIADNVSIHKRFPLKFPNKGGWALSAIALLLVTDYYMPVMDILHREEKARQAAVMERRREEAKQLVEKALAEVNAIPKVGAEEKAITAARSQLQALLTQPIKDPEETARSAQKAIQDAQAMRDRIRDTQKSADAYEQTKMFKSLANSPATGALEETKKALSEGKYDKAISKMQDAVKDFNTADAEKQAKTAQEMAQLAKQLQQMANDPATQQQIKKQLQQNGASAEQAQKMVEEMQKAAAGDQQAAQHLKDMVQNLARQNNGGVLPAPDQLAKLSQQIQQMQGKMNSQQNAQQLSQAAQQMAQAMQQQANQGKQGQQQGQQQQGQSQQANSGQNQQQNGNQGQQQQQQQQAMADAQQAMQDAMSQMQAMQQDAQMADASSGQADGESGAGGKWGEDQQGGNNGQGQGQGNGPAGWNQGGQAAGDRNYKSPAPYSVKKEISKGERDDKGKVLSGWFVKAGSIKGESKEQLKQIIISNEREATDDVEQDRIPMQAQQVVRKYFDSMQQDAK